MKKEETYTAKDIDVLEGLEGIRKRPGVYVGDINKQALFQIIKEVIDNCIDEHLLYKNNKVYIEINKNDMSILVADQGRGIPVENHFKTGISTLTTILTKIHAGGKFSNKSISIGTHGIGISATNALSSKFEIWTYRSSNFKSIQDNTKTWYYQIFEKGIPVSKVIQKKKPPIDWKNGTIVRFIPDASIFTRNYRIPTRKLKDWLKDIKYLCPGLNFILKIDNKEVIFKSKLGISQWIMDIVNERKLSNIGKRFDYLDESLQVSLQWSNLEEELSRSYVNCCYTSENGSHFTGLCKAIYNALNSFSKEKFTRDDLRIGLISIMHLRIQNPIYATQTKEKLTSFEAEQLVKDKLIPHLIKFFQKNKTLTDTIITKAIKLKQARAKFKENKAIIKNISLVSKYSKHVLPGVLNSALRCKPAERELFICEGKSAQGTLKNARDPKYQEVLPLKGKFTNVIKYSSNKVLQNEDIKNIFIAIGSNQDPKDMLECNPNKSRVGKIILLPDEDDDGKHIRCLLLSLFIKYMKALVEEGRIYVVDAPLFVTSYKDKKYFGNSLEEIRKQLPSRVTVYITRMKGWGECSAEDLKTFAMNPKTRKLYQITLTNYCENKVLQLMGSDSIYRKKLLGI